MSEIKLLPCPFCGGEATLRKSEVTQLYHVACFECGCRQDASYKAENVTNTWNTRKPMERTVERSERYYNGGWIPFTERESDEEEKEA